MMESSGLSIEREERLYIRGQADAHGGTASGLAFGGDAPAVRLDQMPGDWQPQARAAGVARLVETIENLG